MLTKLIYASCDRGDNQAQTWRYLDLLPSDIWFIAGMGCSEWWEYHPFAEEPFATWSIFHHMQVNSAKQIIVSWWTYGHMGLDMARRIGLLEIIRFGPKRSTSSPLVFRQELSCRSLEQVVHHSSKYWTKTLGQRTIQLFIKYNCTTLKKDGLLPSEGLDYPSSMV